ncbi:MAG: ribosome biogenesis GTP-binding protein YihA/YsxC [Bacteroidota bacterium]
MKIVSSVFEKSSANVSQCPNSNFIEFAFVGRSNVGKSSLINSILGKRSIAKTSSKPGKTLLINHYKINDKFYFVDLPGYGYANVSKKIINEIELIHKNYFRYRKQLLYTFLLIDIRHDPQKIDIEFMRFLNKNISPFIIVFTKSDKLNENKVSNYLKTYKEYLKQDWEIIPEMIITSSTKKTGIYELLKFTESSLLKNTI